MKDNSPYRHGSRCIAYDTKYNRCFRCTNFQSMHYCEKHLNKSSKFNTKIYKQRNHAIGFNLYKSMMPKTIINLIRSYDYYISDELIGTINGYGSWLNLGLSFRDMYELVIRYNSVSSHKINCVKIIPNDRLLTGSNDGRLRLWDFNNGKLIDDSMNHGTNNVYDIQYLIPWNGEHRIVSYSHSCSHTEYTGNIKIWDGFTFSCIQIIELNYEKIRFYETLIQNNVMLWIFSSGSKIMIYNFLPNQSLENHAEIKENYIEQLIETEHLNEINSINIFSTAQNTQIVTRGWEDHLIKVWVKINSIFICSHILLDDSKYAHLTRLIIKNSTIYSHNNYDQKIKTWDLDSGILKRDFKDIDFKWDPKTMIVLENGYMVCEEKIDYNCYRLIALHFENNNDIVKYVIDINSSNSKNIQLLPDHRILVCFDDQIIKIYDINQFILIKSSSNQHNSIDSNTSNSIPIPMCTFDEINYRHLSPGYSPVDHEFIVNNSNHLISLRGSTIYIWK